MSKFLIIFFIILICIGDLFSWEAVFPEQVNILNYYPALSSNEITYDFIITEESIYFATAMSTEWEIFELPFNLSERSTSTSNEIFEYNDQIYYLLSIGSYSDGLYLMNMETEELELCDWFFYPQFHTFDGTYHYIGHEYGLSYSEDLVSWQEINFFEDTKCLGMDLNENYFVVLTDAGYYYSLGFSENWQICFEYSWQGDFAVQENMIYKVFPDNSDSSGLEYFNMDTGNQGYLFWNFGLNTIDIIYDRIFLGWDQECLMAEGDGVSMYDHDEGLIEINQDEGGSDLPTPVTVNSFSISPYVNCPTIVACTDSGAYWRCIPTTQTEEEFSPNQLHIQNYPNPLHISPTNQEKTTIEFNLVSAKTVKLSIFDIKGRIVRSFQHKNCDSGINHIYWNGKNDEDKLVDSGVYFAKLRIANEKEYIKKILVIK